MTRNNRRNDYDLLIKKTRLALELAKLDVLTKKIAEEARISGLMKTRLRSPQEREETIQRVANKIFERRKQRAKDAADKLLLPNYLGGGAEQDRA